MSYRDLRNFTEMMRSLGYHRHISVENFRTPNFPLVAEILTWLLTRYEPNCDIPKDIETEQDRVIFVRSAAQFMATRAHLKLNTKKLYQADGYAVKELLKVTMLLYNAIQANRTGDLPRSKSQHGNLKLEFSTKLQEAKTFRHLASEITSKGATLYDLFAREVDLRDIRSNVVARQVDMNQVESWIVRSAANVQDEITRTTKLIENVASDEVNLDAKIEKKTVELDRNRKRLQTLQKVRPAFMDEFEKLEVELKRYYEIYLVKFRCLAYLEHLLEEYEWTEKEKMEERETAMQKMIEKLKLEESLNVEVEGDTFSGLEDRIDGPNMNQRPPHANRFGSHSTTGGMLGDVVDVRHKFGSMTGGELEDSDSQLSDSDLGLLDGEDGGSDIASDEEMEIAAVAPVSKANPNPTERLASDDDF